MNLKDQVLSIDQVQELQELGFDINKYSSMCWIYDRLFSTEDETTKAMICQIKSIPTLTIGDIIEILPKEIDFKFGIIWIISIQFLNNKYQVFYSCEKQIARVDSDKKYINALFETLKWCIANKHIAI